MVSKMKKTKIFIFCIACFLCFSFNVKADIKCDIDGDGEITDNDRTLLSNLLLGDLPQSGSEQFYAADCNGDGSIDSKDLVAIKKAIENSQNVDDDNIEKYNNYTSAIVSCGSGTLTNIPSLFPKIISILYNVIQIAVPVVLVVMGSLDLMKGITAQKEDDIKKGQQLFVKRLISAAIVFFVFIIVKLVISFVADNSTNNIMDCAECFIKNECD